MMIVASSLEKQVEIKIVGSNMEDEEGHSKILYFQEGKINID